MRDTLLNFMKKDPKRAIALLGYLGPGAAIQEVLLEFEKFLPVNVFDSYFLCHTRLSLILCVLLLLIAPLGMICGGIYFALHNGVAYLLLPDLIDSIILFSVGIFIFVLGIIVLIRRSKFHRNSDICESIQNASSTFRKVTPKMVKEMKNRILQPWKFNVSSETRNGWIKAFCLVSENNKVDVLNALPELLKKETDNAIFELLTTMGPCVVNPIIIKKLTELLYGANRENASVIFRTIFQLSLLLTQISEIQVNFAKEPIPFIKTILLLGYFSGNTSATLIWNQEGKYVLCGFVDKDSFETELSPAQAQWYVREGNSFIERIILNDFGSLFKSSQSSWPSPELDEILLNHQKEEIITMEIE
jgi:hypothetical protein